MIGAEIIYGLIISGPVLISKDALPKRKASFYAALLADNVGPLAEDAAPAPAEAAPAAEEAPAEAAPAEQAPAEEAAPETAPAEEAAPETAPMEEAAPEQVPLEQAPEQAPEQVPEQAPEQAPEQSGEQPSGEQIPAGGNEENQVETPIIEGETANPVPELSIEEQVSVGESESITNVDNIDPGIVDAISAENALIDQAATPEEKVAIIVDQGEQKVGEVGDLTANDDFSSATLVINRLADQIDEALGQIGSLPPEESAVLKQNLATFADKAETVLRTEQLVVPEKLEQDFEIARAQLFNVQESR